MLATVPGAHLEDNVLTCGNQTVENVEAYSALCFRRALTEFLALDVDRLDIVVIEIAVIGNLVLIALGKC